MAPFITDAQLPAANYLTGPRAIEVLRVPVLAAGGDVLEVAAREVHYRPGGDVVVRFAVSVSWHGAAPVTESHLAASMVDGAHPGGVAVVSEIDGDRTCIGVWRWPFDPVLVGLADALKPSVAAELCGLEDPLGIDVSVLSFQPMTRALVMVATPKQTFYLKVVPPREVPGLIDRHRVLALAGVPVAQVVSTAPGLGIVVLAELFGSTWREAITSETRFLPGAAELDRLAASLASVTVPDDRVTRSIRERARIDAAMLAAVLPGERDRLERIIASIGSADSALPLVTIHGHLHDGQILTEQGRITGLLNVDDVGAGSPVDDRASMIASLRYQEITRSAMHRPVGQHAETLRSDSKKSIDPRELDRVTAAALVTLAAGPFRVQDRDWQTTVGVVLAEADRQLRREPWAERISETALAGSR